MSVIICGMKIIIPNLDGMNEEICLETRYKERSELNGR